jgi:hypothetical protein
MTSPQATKRSFQPSLLRSTMPLPHPDRGRDAMPTPERVVMSSKFAPPRFLKRGNDSLASAVWKMSGRPSLSTSPASAPIPDTASARSPKATARSKAASVKVPLRLFRNRNEGVVSLDTNTSGKPSSSKSATPIPIPFPTCARIPEASDTSEKVPLPSLWKSELGSPWYCRGWQ